MQEASARASRGSGGALSLQILPSANGLKYGKFVIAAGISVPFNVGSRILFSFYLPFGLAIVFSQFVGMTVAFLLTKFFVFKSTRNSLVGELVRFAAVNAISLAQTWVVSVAFLYAVLPALRYTFAPELTAHVIGLAASSLTAFVGHRHFSFREGPSV